MTEMFVIFTIVTPGSLDPCGVVWNAFYCRLLCTVNDPWKLFDDNNHNKHNPVFGLSSCNDCTKRDVNQYLAHSTCYEP